MPILSRYFGIGSTPLSRKVFSAGPLDATRLLWVLVTVTGGGAPWASRDVTTDRIPPRPGAVRRQAHSSHDTRHLFIRRPGCAIMCDAAAARRALLALRRVPLDCTHSRAFRVPQYSLQLFCVVPRRATVKRCEGDRRDRFISRRSSAPAAGTAQARAMLISR